MAKASLLLIDDELPLLALLQNFLERQGYQVETVQSGAEALNVLGTAPERHDLAILDLSLPDIPGEEVLSRILVEAPRVKVLVSSGRPFATEGLPAEQRPRVAAILKPYPPKSLVTAIEALLAGGSAEHGL
jgi:DNA-binding response OmpR family regulator